MQPSKDRIVVAIGALRADSSTWALMAGEMSRLAGTTAGLTLSATELSTGADIVGVTDKYNQLQQRMTEMLKEGAVAVQGISDALKTAADAYQREEDAGVVRLNNIK